MKIITVKLAKSKTIKKGHSKVSRLSKFLLFIFFILAIKFFSPDSTAHAANYLYSEVIDGEIYTAEATSSGVNIYNESLRLSFSSDYALAVYKAIVTSEGSLYFSTVSDVRVVHNINQIADGFSADFVYSASSTPALLGSATGINDFEVKESSSSLDSSSNLLIIATDSGLNIVNEIKGQESKSGAKYVTSSYLSELMIGDVRGMWSFYDNSDGTAVDDISIKNNNLTASANTNTLAVSGIRGKGLTLNSQYASRADDSDFDFSATDDFSISVWAKHNTISDADYLVTKSQSGTNGGYQLYMDSDGDFVFAIDDDSTWDPDDSVGGSKARNFDDNEWHHVVAVKNGNSEIKLYVDGELVDSDLDLSTTGTLSNDDPLYVGIDDNGSSGAWLGELDELMITAQALELNQVKLLYRSGNQALNNHTADRITGVSGADSYQQLAGSVSYVSNVDIDDTGQFVYVAGLDSMSSSNDGALSVLSIGSDTLLDVFNSTNTLKVDDSGTSIASSEQDSLFVSVSGTPLHNNSATDGLIGNSGFLAFAFNDGGSTTSKASKLWLELSDISLYSSLNNLVSSTLSKDLIQSDNLTVGDNNQRNVNLDTGESLVNNILTVDSSNNFVDFGNFLNQSEVDIYGDLTIKGDSTLSSIPDIRNVFIYDTSQDIDGGNWRSDENAKASSWYLEDLDDMGMGNCNLATMDRCSSMEFPSKAALVATSDYLYILDFQDASLWMRFDDSYLLNSGDSDVVLSSVVGLNGKIYIASYDDSGSSSEGLFVIDFISDEAYRFSDSASSSTYSKFSGFISDRNSVSSYIGDDDDMTLVDRDVYDVSVSEVAGQDFIAIGTDSGMSVINLNDSNVFDYSDSSGDDYVSVWLTRAGDLYGVNSTKNQLELWSQVDVSLADEVDGTPDLVLDETSVPAIWSSAPTILTGAPDQLFVSENRSLVDGKGDVIYLGHSDGLTVIHLNDDDYNKSSVKYYNNSFISEMIPGDSSLAMSFNGSVGNSISNGSTITDISINTNNGTIVDGGDSSMEYVSGVRGAGISFDGEDDYISVSDSDNLSFTDDSYSISLWFNFTEDLSANVTLLAKDANNNREYNIELNASEQLVTRKYELINGSDDLVVGSNSLNDGLWHHCVVVADGEYLSLYVDGKLDGYSKMDLDLEAGGPAEMNIGRLPWGAWDRYFEGSIDELFITSDALDSYQIQNIYLSGKMALNRHTANRLPGISNADEYQHLTGSVSKVMAVSVDEIGGNIFIGTNDTSANTGSLSVISTLSDSVMDYYNNSNTSNFDDLGNSISASDNDLVSISVIGSLSPEQSSSNFAFALSDSDNDSDASRLWLEKENFELSSVMADLTSSTFSRGNIQTNRVDLTTPIGGVNSGEIAGSIEVTDIGDITISSSDDSSIIIGDSQNQSTLNVYGDTEILGATTMEELSSINDVFVYDSFADSDGGAWRFNESQATGWYHEGLDDQDGICENFLEPIVGDDRCGSKEFPQKAIIAGTDSAVYIWDASDNSPWMRFDISSSYQLEQDADSVYMSDGVLYVAGNEGTTGTGLYEFDFTTGDVYKYCADAEGAIDGAADGGRYFSNTEISERNSNTSWSGLNTNLAIIEDKVNEVMARTIDGKEYVAIGTDNGVNVINRTDASVVLFSSANEPSYRICRNLWLTESGDLYFVFDNGTQRYFRAYYEENDWLDTGDTVTNVWDQGTSDAYSRNILFPTSYDVDNIADIWVEEGKSTVEDGSNLIYLARSFGLTVIQEDQSDLADSSFKFFNKDYVTEELVGDVTGAYSFTEGDLDNGDDVTDVAPDSSSGGSSTLTAISDAGGILEISGVRGKGYDFDGTNDFLTQKVYEDESGVTQGFENHGLNMVDGNAFVSFGDLDLSSYASAANDYMILVNDDDNITAWGYLDTVGAGESLGSEVVTNGSMESGDPPSNWYAYNITLDGVADERTGGSGSQSLEATYSTGGSATQDFTLTAGQLYKVSAWVKSSSGTGCNFGIAETDPWTTYVYEGISSTSWTLVEGYITPNVGHTGFRIELGVDSSSVCLFDDISIKPVTEQAATGVNIVSTKGGSTQNWANIESNFNSSDMDDYTFDVMRSDFQITGDVSVGAWLKSDVSITSTVDIISKVYSGGADSSYAIQIEDTGNPRFMVYSDGTSSYDATANLILNDNQWYYLVGVYDGSSINLYVNGELLESTNYSSGIHDGSEPFSIGARNRYGNIPAAFFNGIIDEVFVTETALSAEQVRNMYTTGALALQNHDANRVEGISDNDSMQKLAGDTSISKAVAVDSDMQIAYVGTNNSSDGGGVSVISLVSDSVIDYYSADNSEILTDNMKLWPSAGEDILSISLVGSATETRSATVAISSDSHMWMQTSDININEALAELNSSTVNKKRINVNDIIARGDILPEVTDEYNLGSEDLYWDKTYVNTYYGNTLSTLGADLAEDYKTEDHTLEPGDVVVTVDGSDISVARSSDKYQNSVLGVIATSPGIKLSATGTPDQDDIDNIETGENLDESIMRPVALAGRVPVKISTENGEISRGDLLASSSTPGYAMKACGNICNSSFILGRAMEDFGFEDTGDSEEVIAELEKIEDSVNPDLDSEENLDSDKTLDQINSDITQSVDAVLSEERDLGVGRIMMFINLSWYQPTDSLDFAQELSKLDSKFDQIEGLGWSIDGNALVTTLDVVANSIFSTSGEFGILNAESLVLGDNKFFIDPNGNVDIAGDLVLAGVIQGDLGDIVIELDSEEEFIVANSDGEEVFSVDSEGKVTTSKVNIFEDNDPTIGTATFIPGSVLARVDVSVVNRDSKIFLSPKVVDDEIPRLVVKSVGDGYFVIRMDEAREKEVLFDWWVIN